MDKITIKGKLVRLNFISPIEQEATIELSPEKLAGQLSFDIIQLLAVYKGVINKPLPPQAEKGELYPQVLRSEVYNYLNISLNYQKSFWAVRNDVMDIFDKYELTKEQKTEPKEIEELDNSAKWNFADADHRQLYGMFNKVADKLNELIRARNEER